MRSQNLLRQRIRKRQNQTHHEYGEDPNGHGCDHQAVTRGLTSDAFIPVEPFDYMGVSSADSLAGLVVHC
jgi:hypothetical protein